MEELVRDRSLLPGMKFRSNRTLPFFLDINSANEPEIEIDAGATFHAANKAIYVVGGHGSTPTKNT